MLSYIRNLRIPQSILVLISCLLFILPLDICTHEPIKPVRKDNVTNYSRTEIISNSSSRSALQHKPLNVTRPNTRGQATSLKSSAIQDVATLNKHSSVNKTLDLPNSNRLRSRQDGDYRDDYRVPFWNIAHMINSIEHIEPALREGANGIETDISFDKNGLPVECYHGFPCDCGRHCHHREEFVKFVKHLGDLSASESSFRPTLVLLDLKLKDLSHEAKQIAGRYLAGALHENLYNRHLQVNRDYPGPLDLPPIRTVVSINHVTDKILVRSFIGYLRENRLDWMAQHIGFDVGMNDNLNDIRLMWDELEGSSFNIWQGDGLTNCANLVRGLDRLKDAISIRNGQGHFRKIYYWTADVMYQIRSVLRLGLDALLTNQPQRVTQVLEEAEFRNKYRLATPYDDPFAQFWIQPSAWKMSPPTLGETIETVSNIQKTSVNFFKNLPDGISAIFKKVQHTITQ